MTHADVVVVGAGFAGLTAATVLQQQGYDVEVVEARDRVGGKTDSQLDDAGRRVDTGGQFVCDDMPNIVGLVQQLGMHLVSVDHDRSGHAFVGGGLTTADPAALWTTFEQADAAYAGIWDMQNGPDGPDGPDGTLGAWLASLGLEDAVVQAARSSLAGVMCVSVDDLPFAHVVDLANRTPLTRDELQYVVHETMHSVAEQLAGALTRPVRLSTPASSIEVDGSSVLLRTEDGNVTARHVIVAIPPSAYGSITFVTPLPQDTIHAANAFRAGSVVKFLIGYDRAFWHRDDVGPTAVWIDPAGLYLGDASLPGAPMLVAFLGGPSSEAWRRLTAADRRATLLERLIEAYGPDAASPRSIVERDWPPDRWGGGGYWNVLVSGDHHDAVDVLRRGAPSVTFASTELAASFPGYIEGAISAGRAAAATVAAIVPIG
ncbi:MAG: flavin monoamine oxidase family protein [Ilumatobacteraceae bacterium]|nr:flavin monoamine oxidase family protein [Ilumatobacteraceae bacterium]